jgi:hypothetical protein
VIKSVGARLYAVLLLVATSLVGTLGLATPVAEAVGADPTTYVGAGPLTSLSNYYGTPNSFVSDASGNIYFASNQFDLSGGDYANRVWKAAPDGSVTLLATGGGTVTDLALGSGGDVYFVDSSLQVKKVSAAGSVSVVAGTGVQGSGGDGDGLLAINANLTFITGIAVGPGDVVYLVEFSGHIRKVDGGIITTLKLASGSSCSSLTGTLAGATFGPPVAIAVDSSSNLYLAAFCGFSDGYQVVRVTPSLTTSVVLGGGSTTALTNGLTATSAKITAVTAVGVGADGTLYLSTAGVLLGVSGGVLSLVAGDFDDNEFSNGTAAALVDTGEFFAESAGSILVTGWFNAAGLGRLSTAPRTLTVLTPGMSEPADGTVMFNRPLNQPIGLAIAPNGDLVFTAATAGKLRTINSSGALATIAGNGDVASPTPGPALSSSLPFATAPEVDQFGNAYLIAQSQVLKVTPGGTLSILAGTGASGIAADGAQASTSPLAPLALDAGPDGTMYVLAGNLVSGIPNSWAVRTVGLDGRLGTVATVPLEKFPSDFALNTDGSLIYAPGTGSTLLRIASNGAITETPFAPGVNAPSVAVDPAGNTFLVQGTGLFKMTPAGVVSQVGSTGGTDIAIAANGDVFVLAGNSILRYAGLATAATSFKPVLGNDVAFSKVSSNVTIAVSDNDSVPTGVLGPITIGTGPSHGTASVSGSDILYTPTTGYKGADSFTYVRCNAASLTTCSTATVTITVADPILAPVDPARLFDTRPGEAQGTVTVTKQKIGGDTILKVKVLGKSGLPASGVGAVSLNVTVADPDGGGFVTVYPCGTRPNVSSVNFVASQVVPNAVIAPLSAEGEVCFYSNVPTHLIADVNGWLATSSGFATVEPARLFDTRPGEAQGTVSITKQKIGGATELRVKVTGASGVPAVGVGAVSLNVTVADPEGAGFVTVYPCGTRPLVSSLNFVASQVVPNAVIAPLSAGGEVCFFSNTATHLLADVNGWFATSAGFATVTPSRVFDTRAGEAQGTVAITKQRIGGDTILKVKFTGASGIPASGVGAVSLNVTAVEPSGAGFVTVYPCGPQPGVSSLNFVAGQVVPNAVIAPVSASGEVCFFSNVSTDLIADVNGWFSG